MPLESSFSYCNSPQAVLPRKKYRSEEETPLTLMSDPRVVRGAASRGGTGLSRGNTAKTRNFLSKERPSRISRDESPRAPSRPTYQYHVKEVVQSDVDLSRHLVEQPSGQEKKPPKSAEAQTDQFQERPESPEFIPRKTGVDVHTQVEDVRELFDFDREVEPLVAVLCAKTLEQAVFEVEREAELESLQSASAGFEEVRARERQWAVDREQQTAAGSCAKDLALSGLKLKMSRARDVRLKVAGVQAMRQMLPALVEEISEELFAAGEWRDPETSDIDTDYLPQVYKRASERLQLYRQSQALVDEILLLAFEGKEGVVEEGTSGRVIRLMVSPVTAGVDSQEDVLVGEVLVRDGDSVQSVNRRVNAKLAEEGLRRVREVDVSGFLWSAMGLSSEEQVDTVDFSKLPAQLRIVVPDEA